MISLHAEMLVAGSPHFLHMLQPMHHRSQRLALSTVCIEAYLRSVDSWSSKDMGNLALNNSAMMSTSGWMH